MNSGRTGIWFRPIVSLLICLLALVSLLSCGGGGGKLPGPGDPNWHPITPPHNPTPSEAREARLNAVSSWNYILQFPEAGGLDSIAQSDYDLFVVDYSRDGTDATAFTPADIAAMKEGHPGRIVLCYMSIGEAEDYRFYWQTGWTDEGGNVLPVAPGFLGPLNPDWPGNYKVRYWDEDWQKLIIGDTTLAVPDPDSYLGRILAAGFDGVYLDIVDAYEYWGPGGEHHERDDAARLMAQFVARIAKRARELAGDGFIVVPQNATHLYAELTPADSNEYLAAFDAVGAEDVFYYGGGDMDNPLNVQELVLADLRALRDSKKRILSIEYLSEQPLVDAYLALAAAEGFVPLAAGRELNALP